MSVLVDPALAVRAKFFRGLADPSQLALLLVLRTGEKTVSQLSDETGLSPSNVSNHLACLKDCGLVLNRQEWRLVHYRIADEKILAVFTVADAVMSDHAQRIIDCVNYEANNDQ